MKSSTLLKNLTIAVLIICIGTAYSYGQIVKETTKKVERKTENRVDNKIDQGIDKGLNAIEGLFKRKKKKKPQQEEESAPVEEAPMDVEVKDNGNVEVNGVEISYDDEPVGDATPNAWQGRFSMEMVEYKDGKEKDRSVMQFHLDTYKTAFVNTDGGRNGEVSTVIFDRQYRTMTTKTDSDGEKQAVVMKVPTITVNTDEVYEDTYDKNNLPRATGEYKMISGYRCQKYVYEDDEVSGEAWITNDADFNMMDVFGAMSVNPTGKAAQPPKGSAFSFQNGMVIQSSSIEKRTGRRSEMTMGDIVQGGQDSRVFNLNGYNIVKMPNMSNLFQQKN